LTQRVACFVVAQILSIVSTTAVFIEKPMNNKAIINYD